MKEGWFLRIGGYISGGVLIVLGIVVIVLGIWGFSFTRDHIEREGITFGPASDPAVQEHAEQWAGEPVDTGRKALAMAEIMREHTLSSTGGLTYAEMGRYQSAANPDDPKGTNDETAAAKDESGQPISNGARNIWVTETALATALDMGFMSEMLSIFSVVVGIALLLTGIGLVILALAVFGRWRPVAQTSAAPTPVPGAAAGQA
jgi:hypothetical protein